MDFKSHFLTILRNFLLGFLLLFLINLLLLSFSYQQFPGLSGILFQTISLITLTGFAPVDFYQIFTISGQWFYAFLLQINVLFYAYFLYRMFHVVSAKNLSQELTSAFFQKRILREVVAFLLILELGMLIPMLYISNGSFDFANTMQLIHFSISYVIGAIGNVKINLLDSNTIGFDPNGLLLFKLLLTAGVFVGKLGLPVLRDLIHPGVLRMRLKHPEVDWKPYTKIALFGLLILITISSLILFFEEQAAGSTDLPLLDRVFAPITVSLNAGFGGATIFPMEELSGFSFWTIALLTCIGGGIYSTSGGVGIIILLFFLKKKFIKQMMVYVGAVLLIQVASAFLIGLILSDNSFKSTISIQINAFFNGGWSEIDFENGWSLFYLSFIMTVGRMMTLLAPWYIFIKINSGKLPKEISS